MDIKEHYIDWIKTVEKAESDPEFAQLIMEKSCRDPVYFFNNWLWTYDPRKKIKTIPFKLFDIQEKFIYEIEDCYQKKDPLLVEKSRDMGFSWIVLGWIVWKSIQENGFSAGLGSRKMQLVDDIGNMKSLMERVRFLLNKLPLFMRCGYVEKINSKRGVIRIPSTMASITGEAGDDIGRGDRTSVYILDEFAHVERSSIVQEAVSQTSDFIIYGSTPKGKGNEFARLRWKTKMRRFVLHWKDHPGKTEQWYEKQKEFMTESQIAQELDINYEKSAEGRVYKWFETEKHAKTVKYNPNYPVLLTFDWGIGDPTACLFIQYIGNIIHIFDSFETKDSTIYQTMGIVADKLRKYDLNLGHVAAWYGDPDGRNRNIITGDSIKDFLKDRYGVTLRYKLPNLIAPRVLAVKMMGEHHRILIDEDQHHVIECFQNYRYPDKDHGENEKPVHDWTSHTMSALEYYCVTEHGMDQFRQDLPIISTSWR